MAASNLSRNLLAVALFILPCTASAIVNTAQLKSDLIILSDNDLYNEKSNRTTGAILLSTSSTNPNAIPSCQLLGEKLWSPELQDFQAGLNSSLSYQIYQGSYSRNQLFWIAADKSKNCRAINSQGRITASPCSTKLPVLCTQSSPLGNATLISPSLQNQITVPVGDLSLTGSREFHAFKFLGVRFAPNPQRYAYSTVYHGTNNATAFEPKTCIQAGGIGSEDCLFLNVWTTFIPADAKSSRKKLKPVMVWIFGGGFVSGTAYDPFGGSDGTQLASRGDVVVVSLNYRLGNLGMLALNDGVTNGTYTIQDIITGLQWVREYITSFGGDPDRVTVFGQSSGAAGVRALLASPKAEGLFHGAIMQSGPGGFGAFGPYSNYSTIDVSYNGIGKQVLSLTGCLNSTNQLACLRGLDANVLVNLPVAANFPVIDGTYLTAAGIDFTHKTKIPLIIGIDRDEFAISLPYPPPNNITLAFEYLSSILGADLTSIPKSPLFPLPSASPDPALNLFNLTSRVLTLGGFQCLTHATAYSSALHHTFPNTYSFIFNRTYQPPNYTTPPCNAPITPDHPFGDPNKEYYKCHAGEAVFPFGTLSRMGLEDRDGKDTAFEQLILDYWSSFARTGDPNIGKGYLQARGYWGTLERVSEAGRWEEVRKGRVRDMLLQWEGGMVGVSEEEGKQCGFLDLGLDYYEGGV